MRDLLPLHAGAWAQALAYTLAYALAFALTLALAAWLTPRSWWRRPTLRGGAVLAAGTVGFGTLLLALAGRPQAAPTLALASADAAPRASAAPQSSAPAPGASYRVAEELNLRATRGIHSTRLAVLPAGSWVVASGALDGDWWQVRARVGGRSLVGWTSSLWLRRGDETSPQLLGKPRNPTH